MTTIAQIKAANAAAGFHFFEADTMRFFRSRIAPGVYEGPGGVYFITSEQFEFRGERHARKYTVTQAFPDGSVERASEFQQFATLAQARVHAKRLAKGEVTT